MNAADLRIVELAPMRVASFHGFGAAPESLAFEQLKAWMEAHDLMKSFQDYRIFGFNNPSPAAGSPNYGYEVWITVGPEVEEEEGMAVKHVDGGRYAVMRCTVTSGEEIPACWQKLVARIAERGLQHGHHQWLEEHLWTAEAAFEESQLTLDLYAPIRD